MIVRTIEGDNTLLAEGRYYLRLQELSLESLLRRSFKLSQRLFMRLFRFMRRLYPNGNLRWHKQPVQGTQNIAKQDSKH